MASRGRQIDEDRAADLAIGVPFEEGRRRGRRRCGQRHEKEPELRSDEDQRGEHNELTFFKADEDTRYNERPGTQGESPDPADERRLAHSERDES
jgi:hypothetical protein